MTTQDTAALIDNALNYTIHIEIKESAKVIIWSYSKCFVKSLI